MMCFIIIWKIGSHVDRIYIHFGRNSSEEHIDMDRKVYLVGEIEKRFGSEFSMCANSYSDVIKCIQCNRPGFKQYLLECHENGIDFTINSAGKDIEEKDLLTPLKEGDITIAALPAGSKSDAMKVVAAIALIYIGVVTGQMGNPAYMETVGQLIVGMGITLGTQGIQGMLAPDPATEAEEEDGYLYSGGTNVIVEGDPVPLLYGELRVAGQPISIGMETYVSANVSPASATQATSTSTNNIIGTAQELTSGRSWEARIGYIEDPFLWNSTFRIGDSIG